VKKNDLMKNDSGKKKLNKPKNRFRDVLPYDHARVRLETIEGKDDSDYINASWIMDIDRVNKKDEKVLKRYISTQGPHVVENSKFPGDDANTIGDFWRMTWQEGVECIVMLTKISEDERESDKCAQYWPVKGTTAKYDDIEVTLEKDEEPNSDLIVRYFKLKKKDEVRDCIHVQYIGWPDHEVPRDEKVFIKLTEDVDKYNKNNKTMIVHCSAGVGRTGTFIAVHSYVRYLRKYYQDEKDLPDINIPGKLISLRQDRPRMIQTKEQYEFVYKAITLVFNDLLDKFEKERIKN